MLRRYRLWSGTICVLLGGLVAAQDAPKPVAVVPSSFRAFVATDERYAPEKGQQKNVRNRADKMHCMVCDNGLNPVVAVFSRTLPNTADSGISKLAVKLNELVVTDKVLKAERFGAFVVFLTLAKEYPEDAKRDESRDAAKKLAEQLKTTGVPFALAPGKSETTTAWGLLDADDVTVIFYNKMNILQRWSYTADKGITDDDVKKISERVTAEFKSSK